MAKNLMRVSKSPVIFVALFSAIVNPDLLRQSGEGLYGSSALAGSTQEVKEISIDDAIGVITLNRKLYSRERKIQILDDDGSLWYEFSFYDDGRDRKFGRANLDFQPFAFHPDYFVLALKCLGQDASRFKVVVNEATGLTKFVRKSDHVLKFQTWGEHILDLFAVGFDQSKNPLRIAPAGGAKTVRLLQGVTFHPLQIKGRWLRVRWNISDERKDRAKRSGYGWVKWKENNKLLLDLFYFS